ESNIPIGPCFAVFIIVSLSASFERQRWFFFVSLPTIISLPLVRNKIRNNNCWVEQVQYILIYEVSLLFCFSVLCSVYCSVSRKGTRQHPPLFIPALSKIRRTSLFAGYTDTYRYKAFSF